MNAKHTPTPWHIGGNGTIIYCGNGWGIANATVLHAHHEGPETSKANAEFIVRACNLHEELVEALQMVRDADEDCKRDGLPTIPAIARAKIDAALAKAEGKE